MKNALLFSLFLLASPSAYSAVMTIAFESAANGSLTSHTEGGFELNVTGVSSDFEIKDSGSVSPLSGKFLEAQPSGTNAFTLEENDTSTPFLFVGFDASSSSSSAIDITLQGYSGAGFVAQETFTLNANSSTTFSASSLLNKNVSTLIFSVTTGAGETISIDNFQVDNLSVPEPSSTALLGLGSLALILRRRRD